MSRTAFSPRRSIVLLLLGAILLTSCSQASSSQQPSEPEDVPSIVTLDASYDQQLPATVDSADGREVTIEDNSRIVPLWGSIAEIIFGLGLGENVVGRDISATFPEAQHLPLVTRAHDISAEGVLSLRPSVVLGSENSGPAEAINQIRSVGVPIVLFKEPASIDDIIPRIRSIAASLGVPDAGEALVARTEGALAAAKATIPGEAAQPTVAFLYMRGQAGVYLLAGPGSGADSMIEAAGGIDAGSAMGLTRPFTPLTSEALVTAAPDIILMTTTGLESVGGTAGLMEVPGVAQTPAGKNGRVVAVEDGLLYSFGPRTPEALELLISKLYAPTAEAAAR